jgi:hypothetical protein
MTATFAPEEEGDGDDASARRFKTKEERRYL